MQTSNLQTNQLSDFAYEWYRSYLEAMDAKDIDAYADFLGEDIELVMNNEEPVKGRDAVKAGLDTYWQSFGTIEHDLRNIYGSDDAFMLEAINNYETLDGRSVSRLFTDTSPLFEAEDGG